MLQYTKFVYTVLFVLQMSICVCAQISMRVRESGGITSKPSPAVRSISKPRSRGIPHYITPSPAGNPRVPAGFLRGGNPCRPLRKTTISSLGKNHLYCVQAYQKPRESAVNLKNPLKIERSLGISRTALFTEQACSRRHMPLVSEENDWNCMIVANNDSHLEYLFT